MTVTIANAAGFWGDRIDAPRQLLERQAVDYLQLEYLAEVTMGVLERVRSADPTAGYATDFVEYVLPEILEFVAEGTTVVTNAGGLNPVGCARDTLTVAADQGVDITVGVVTGDELTDEVDALDAEYGLEHLQTGAGLSAITGEIRTAAAYLGAEPIAEALDAEVDIVITGRVTDPALVLGPLCHEYGWTAGEWNRLAAGIVAGHLIECGTQVTGGNSLADWAAVPYEQIGYPIATVSRDGTVTITKPPDTGGTVTRETVCQQLVYEIGDPTAYLTPDVTADFTTPRVSETGPNEVTLTGIEGRPPPSSYKAVVHHDAGYRLTETLLYAAPDALAKARRAADLLEDRIAALDLAIEATTAEYIGHNAAGGPAAAVAPDKDDHAEVMLRFAARSRDRAALERLAMEFAPLSLTGPPAVTGLTGGGRPEPQRIVGAWPTTVPERAVTPTVDTYTAVGAIPTEASG